MVGGCGRGGCSVADGGGRGGGGGERSIGVVVVIWLRYNLGETCIPPYIST